MAIKLSSLLLIRFFDNDYISSLGNDFILNIWDPHNSDLNTYLNQLWNCSVCITDRAHGAILAGIGDVIPLIIKTTDKSDQIFSLLGVSQLMPNFNYKTNYTLKDLTSIVHNKADILHRLRQKVLANYNQLNNSLDNIL